MKQVLVIGGGISGLAAAHGCTVEASDEVKVTVLERADTVGGKAVTLHENGFRVEAGPTGFLDNEPALDELVQVAGLTKLPAQQAAARRFLFRAGRLREIQAHPLKFATSGILGPRAMLRVLREPWIARVQPDVDESVWQFAARRLGPQVADRLIAPMVHGVFAGDARQLSLQAAFPRMAELERDHGSLIRAMFALRRNRQAGGPTGPTGTLTSFAEGLAELPRALAARGRFNVRTGTPVESVRRTADGSFQVIVSGERMRADAVILAGEVWAMAPLVEAMTPALAAELRGIPYPPVAVVALGFPAEAIPRVPRGFGALVSRGEGYRMLGCLWDTHLFPGRSPEQRLLIRVMLGGALEPDVATRSTDELIRIAREETARMFDWNLSPVYERAIVWPRAIPQYQIGHTDRVARIDRELARLPGLFQCGNGLRGVAFGKSAAQGLACGRHVGRWITRRPSRTAAHGA